MGSKIVNELRIRLIRGEQATFSCSFVKGERSHRNRPASTASVNEKHFSLDMSIFHHVCMARSADFGCAKQTLFVGYYY